MFLYLGEINVSIEKHNNSIVNLPFFIFKSRHKLTSLLGRSWLNILNPEWRQNIL